MKNNEIEIACDVNCKKCWSHKLFVTIEDDVSFVECSECGFSWEAETSDIVKE